MHRSKLPIFFMIAMVLIAVTAISGCTSSGTSDNTGLKSGLPDSIDYKIDITGGTHSPVTVSYADMKAMEFIEKKGVTMINSVGTEKTSDYAGIPMMSILDKAGIPDGEVSFKVSAPDGYNKVYTKEQMQKSMLGFKENGTVLTNNINSKSCIKMVVPEEPGDMWMKLPVKIDIIQGQAQNPDSSEPVALNITGKIDNAKKFRLSDLKSNPIVSISVPYKDNKTLNATGVSLNKLLDEAGVKSDATGVMFVAADGFNRTVKLSDVRAAQDSIIAINDTSGTLRDIVPGQAFNTWVDKLVTIEIV